MSNLCFLSMSLRSGKQRKRTQCMPYCPLILSESGGWMKCLKISEPIFRNTTASTSTSSKPSKQKRQAITVTFAVQFQVSTAFWSKHKLSLHHYYIVIQKCTSKQYSPYLLYQDRLSKSLLGFMEIKVMDGITFRIKNMQIRRSCKLMLLGCNTLWETF